MQVIFKLLCTIVAVQQQQLQNLVDKLQFTHVLYGDCSQTLDTFTVDVWQIVQQANKGLKNELSTATQSESDGEKGHDGHHRSLDDLTAQRGQAQ